MPSQTRQLSVLTELAPGALTLVGLTGHEALSELFGFELDLVAPGTTPIPFDRLLGRPATVGVGGGRFFNGIVSRLSQGARDRAGVAYRAELVPQQRLLSLQSGNRIFQDMSVPEIVGRVHERSGAEAAFRLEGDYAKRDYVALYDETDLAFISRMVAEEGIFYFFEHGPSGEMVVYADTLATAADAGTFPFDDGKGNRVDPARVTAWEKTQELTAGKVTLRDHHFAVPGSPLEGTATIVPAVQAGQVTHRLDFPGTELYEYPGGYAERFDGAEPGDPDRLRDEPARAAARRMEAEAARALVVAGASTVRTFAPGVRFALAGHPNADGAYVLTAVRHSASQPAGADGDVGFGYANEFTCIPAGVPFRPLQPADRPVAHLQTAVVVGPAGARIHTDRFGRVKVQFFWDREGRHDEHGSRWIRVSQPVGGAGAAFWLPEVGDEVLVAFEHGDPDRPYVLGRVFDSDDRPPDDR